MGESSCPGVDQAVGGRAGLDVRAAYADAKTTVVHEVLAASRAVARRRLRRFEPSRRGRVRDAVRFPFMAHTCRLVPASDVNWLQTCRRGGGRVPGKTVDADHPGTPRPLASSVFLRVLRLAATAALACDLTLQARWAGRRPRSAGRGGRAGRSGGPCGRGRLLPGFLGGLFDRRVPGGGPAGPALGPAGGASGGFRCTRWRAKRAQQPRKPAAHPVG